MGIMDKAMDAMKQAGELAGKAVDEVKERGADFQLQRKRDGLMKDLGEVVYRQRSGEGGLDDEIDRLVASIRTVAEEIAATD